MSDRYDVAIAGAGPAGAQCARDLAARDYDVVVLETEPEAEFPRQSNKSTAGTFPSMMSAFGVPDDVVMSYTDDVVLESPNSYYESYQPGAVLEFAEFKRFLVADGRENGAEYRFDARVSRPILDDDGVIEGVRYNGDEAVYADVVVDATGPAAPIASALDVVDLERENQAIGIEYEMAGVEMNHPEYADLRRAMMLRLDHDVAPGGYAWIFATGEDTAKVGLCYIQNDRHREFADDGKTIDGYLEDWLATDPRFADAERIDGKVHRGSAHIQRPDRMHTDRFLAIGDTVPSIDPLWGEGIHKGMKSARAAAATVDRCLTDSDRRVDAESLSVYERLWHRDVAPRAGARIALTELLYLAPNERYDRLMNDLRAADENTLQRANRGEKSAMAKLLHLDDFPLLARYARERFGT
ncbi:NAD(P)/FAD-dependent oxidoreductase [Halorubrum sp. CBA1125]|uniref:digeranylgeranylglycerophospholipid reductase n=1 Tax=Halorubrum sp. CBA1125 TaxID=2668072 RepID=UPI0012E96D50|nr:digeranylgeranylglycerophospholipid reductase [Halorubrum sp. CBA1125]MUW14717.1 NAD(P)/FAD-dependent oxidoreductase [Halorubrum sp. CBA1125]